MREWEERWGLTLWFYSVYIGLSLLGRKREEKNRVDELFAYLHHDFFSWWKKGIRTLH